MILVAHDAVSRFLRTRRRPVRMPAARWLPLAMRWRRPRRLRARSTMLPHTMQVQQAWHSHVHWHLGPGVADVPRAVVRRFVWNPREQRRAMAAVERHGNQPVTAIVPSVATAPMSVRRSRRSPVMPTRPARWQPSTSREMRASSRIEQPRTASVSRHHTHTQFLSRARSVERTFSTTRVDRHRHDRLTEWRDRRGATATTAVGRDAGARGARVFRPVEIAWRTPGGAVTTHDQAAPRRSFDALTQTPQPTTAQSAAVPVMVASEAKRPAVLQISDLDASVVDRLTDDVIRRVERRVRIERERRGM